MVVGLLYLDPPSFGILLIFNYVWKPYIVRREVWSHGKIVRSLLRLCERLSNAAEEEEAEESVTSSSSSSTSSTFLVTCRGRRLDREEIARSAQGLEKRWQLLYLDCLELECAIQHRATTLKQGSPLSANPVDSDEEPVKKHRRLADIPPASQDGSNQDEVDCLMDADEEYGRPLADDDEVMEIEVNSIQQELDLANESMVTSTISTEDQPSVVLQDADVDEETLTPTVQLRIADVTIVADENLSPRPDVPVALDDRKLFIDEIAKYTRSDCNGRVGTFYFMHKDTDTEDGGRGERGAVTSPDAAKTEESSEEEWTYTAQTESNNNEKSTIDHQPEIARPPKEIIKQLVKKAEKLVLHSPQRAHNKSFVEEWLLQYPDGKTVGDSCDASGEYTTEDDELESRGCDGLNSSNQDLDATLVHQASFESVGPANDLPTKVILRAKKREGVGQQRPWSVSGASDAAFEQMKLPHSISESAIHEMFATATCVKMDSSMHTTSTLSSSTVEDTAQTQEGSGGGYSSNSLRRRKIKLRKRTAVRKSESGSEGLLVQSDSSHPTTIGSSPVKVPFLKSSARRLSGDKVADSPHRRYVPPVESPSSSGSTSSDAESDVSVKMRRKICAMPSFRIGPAHTLSSYAMDRKPVPPVSNDSSYSEQAWDNYQEKYMSEPYSEEPPDSEAARRLLEFGDDYRNFLDSQSDCASSSLGRNTFHRRPRKMQHVGETDSDLDDVWNLINTSKDRLHFSEQVFKNQLSRASPHLVLASDFAELVSTCKDNVKVLKVVLENLEDVTSLMSEQECKEIRGLIERWEGLEKKSEDLQKVRFFAREISALKEQLLEIGDRVARLDVKVEDRDQLELRIEDVQREVGRLKSLKPSLLQVNVAVHRFLTETGNAEAPNTLKDEVADLYSTFDETCSKVFSVEENLKDVTKAWQQFESYLATLQIALRSDSENLRKLDEALSREEGTGNGCKVSTHIATSVKDLAILLSEKEQANKLNDSQSIYEMMTGGGNYSDSGISDSGSEVDLSEREKRLAALRRLVRHLEAVLAPGSAAIVNMSKRIEQTEKELKGLQVTCRELIDRTNVFVESKAPLLASNGFTNTNALRGDKTTDDDCSSRGPGSKIKAWLWRAVRAGLPFQLAVIAILCIACLLEPQCCDTMNNFAYAAPQLRYVKGPPPV
ncbi:Hypothetical protein NTJ_06724 [Nesidiocoris tenuis]|uniref:KASH domain-containing protein n=1 Tax=Nesidiocoris tenuis TaxID=355587 RepID=A0ABN7ASK8_9HEMI|nr:Hypothetical protein NTJ_06724 [Nesidiocoris tenuis]